MTDTLIALIADHGLTAAGWALSLLAMAATWLLTRSGLAAKWRDLIAEVGVYVRDAVMYVFQVYVEAIKAGRADGKLTDEEKAHALALAVAAVKERLGWRKLLSLGGGLVGRLLGGSGWQGKVDALIGKLVEAEVGKVKVEAKAVGLHTSGTRAEPPPVPR